MSPEDAGWSLSKILSEGRGGGASLLLLPPNMSVDADS
jgi:hypothetical protein